MENILKGKHVLVLVSGGIAIYKTLDLISRLKKLGAEIKVVMTQSARKFINPLTFEALAQSRVLCEESESWADKDAPNHISYARFADIAIVAPATTNIIAKLACGITDNLVCATLSAAKCPILIAPSANINMLESTQNVRNLETLRELNYEIIPSRTSRLACDIVANGAMAEVEEMIFCLKKTILGANFNFRVIVSGGGSIENIDPIRHISNNSSGKQSANLALAFYYLGAEVIFVSSKFPIPLPRDIKQIKVESSAEFKSEIKKHINKNSILIMNAAISDYIPKKVAKNKLKKEALGESWNLELIKNEDILSEINCAFKVGFKAESDKTTAETSARNLLKPKKDGGKACDMAILNIIDEKNKIGDDKNEVLIFAQNMEKVRFKRDEKSAIAFKIAQIICQQFNDK